jgi:hypothetical protein
MKKGQKSGLIGHEWQEPQQWAFEELIDHFITILFLRYYNPKPPLYFEINASHRALTGILSQLFENQ